MLRLAEQQAALADYLGNPQAEQSDALGLQPAAHAAIHRNNSFVALTGALAGVYPVVERLVGAEFFVATAREYVRMQPPASPVLLDYGGGFAGFLAAFPPAAGLPYLADVARLEWAWHRACHAADAAPLVIAALLALPPDELPRLRLPLHPSRHFLASAYPVDAIWRANQEGAADGAALQLEETDCRLLVARPRFEVVVLRLEPACDVFARALDAGLNLGEAAEAAGETRPDFDVAGALRLLAGAEVFAGLPRPDAAATRGTGDA